VKESSDSEPSRGAGEPPQKNCALRPIVFSLRLARARVSLSCESACRAQAGAVCVCVCKNFSRGRSRSVSYPGVICVEEQAGMFNATCVLECSRPIRAS